MKKLILILMGLLIINVSKQTTMDNDSRISEVIKHKINRLQLEFSEIATPDFSITLDNKTLAVRNKNPGNLKSFKTGKFRIFSTFEEGYSALLHDIDLKITGKSVWTNKTIMINDFINIYAPSFENNTEKYIEIFCSETGLHATDLLNTQDSKLIARGIIRAEDIDLYKQMYSSEKKNIEQGKQGVSKQD